MAEAKRQVTLGTTYYNNPDNLKEFIDYHLPYCDELIVVDDGSTLFPARDIIKKQDKLKLYQVKKDYGFNSHGCRNLIMTVASNDWIVLLDSDRKLQDPEYAFNVFKTRNFTEDALYKFIAFFESNKAKTIHMSVNDFFVNRNFFMKAGGYDEELIGCRTGDREYFTQLAHFGPEIIMHDIDLILERKASITLSNNDIISPLDRKFFGKRLTRILLQRSKNPNPNKKILTFEWEQVF